MAKQPPNHHKPWSRQDIALVRDLAAQNTPTGLIAYRAGRSKGAVYNAASEHGIPLKPTNQSPYNRRKR